MKMPESILIYCPACGVGPQAIPVRVERTNKPKVVLLTGEFVCESCKWQAPVAIPDTQKES